MIKKIEPVQIFKKHTNSSDTMNKEQFRSALIEVLSMFVKVEDLAKTENKQKKQLIIG